MYENYNFTWHLLHLKLRKTLYNSIKDAKIYLYVVFFQINIWICHYVSEEIQKFYIMLPIIYVLKRPAHCYEVLQKCKALLCDVQKTRAITLALLLFELWPFEQRTVVFVHPCVCYLV